MRLITTEIVREMDAALLIEAVKPPRLNFAGVCLRCGERDCESAECIAWHTDSCWMVCPDCGGEEWNELLEACGCTFGVVEAWPEAAA